MRRQPQNDGIVRLRRAGNAGTKTPSTGQITVPAHLCRDVPYGTLFRAELVDEGILFRFVETDPANGGPIPEWVAKAKTQAAPE